MTIEGWAELAVRRPNRPGRDHAAIRHVGFNGRTVANQSPGADLHVQVHRGTHADQGAFTNSHTTGKRCPG